MQCKAMAMDGEGVVCSARRQLIKERIELAGKLLVKAQQLKHGGGIKGFQRIERKIKAEKNFLESVSCTVSSLDILFVWCYINCLM